MHRHRRQELPCLHPAAAADLQIEYSLLSRGLLSGHWSKDRDLAAGGFRGSAPRFTGQNLDRNLALVQQLGAVADAKGATAAQLAIVYRHFPSPLPQPDPRPEWSDPGIDAAFAGVRSLVLRGLAAQAAGPGRAIPPGGGPARGGTPT